MLGFYHLQRKKGVFFAVSMDLRDEKIASHFFSAAGRQFLLPSLAVFKYFCERIHTGGLKRCLSPQRGEASMECTRRLQILVNTRDGVWARSLDILASPYREKPANDQTFRV
jgi:hypothetical protein